jgi:hypothetical protein
MRFHITGSEPVRSAQCMLTSLVKWSEAFKYDTAPAQFPRQQ